MTLRLTIDGHEPIVCDEIRSHLDTHYPAAANRDVPREDCFVCRAPVDPESSFVLIMESFEAAHFVKYAFAHSGCSGSTVLKGDSHQFQENSQPTSIFTLTASLYGRDGVRSFPVIVLELEGHFLLGSGVDITDLFLSDWRDRGFLPVANVVEQPFPHYLAGWSVEIGESFVVVAGPRESQYRLDLIDGRPFDGDFEEPTTALVVVGSSLGIQSMRRPKDPGVLMSFILDAPAEVCLAAWVPASSGQS
jgi:hypothetical protein